MAGVKRLLLIEKVIKTLLKFISIFFLSIFLSACTNENTATIITKDGVEHKFNVEIADTNETRAKGLMFVQELAPNAGMLFDFKEERQVAFWMQNTFIPLDMIFIRADGIIANIHVNAKPQDTTTIPSDGAVRFVLEINGGRSVELGIEKGDRLVHTRVQQGKKE